MTFNEQIDSLLSKQKEVDYLVITTLVKEYLVTWHKMQILNSGIIALNPY
jgi:hypothetical protein